jgi:spermidine synthase
VKFPLTLGIAAASGWISLSYEILWFRVYSFASGGSPTTFGLLLGFYLAGLAIGANLSRLLCRTSSITKQRQLERFAVVVFVANLIGYAVIPVLAALIGYASWSGLLLLVTFSATLFGATLPLISHFGISADDRAGARLSYVYLANIVGSGLGTLITGFALLDVWTTSQVALTLALFGFALVLAILLLIDQAHVVRIASVSILFLAAAGLASAHSRLFDKLYERLLFKQPGASDSFADIVENREGVIAVTKSLRVYGGGAYDGVISTDLLSDRNFIIRAYGAAAVHPHPRNVLMIGLSTGAWAQVIANSADVERLTIVEINPGYLRLIAKYPQVSSLLSNPKVHIVIDDGRRWLVHHPGERFDLVIQNTTEHWRAHTTNLLSREYLALVRSRLRPGGIFHYNTTDSQDAYKTAFTVFPYGLRFVNFATVSDAPIRLDPIRWRQVLEQFQIDGRPVFDLRRSLDRNRLDSLVAFASTANEPPRFLGLETREAMLKHLALASVVTDDNMLPEWRTLLLTR